MQVINNTGSFEVIHNNKLYTYIETFKTIYQFDELGYFTGTFFKTEVTTIEGMKSAVYGIASRLAIDTMVYVEYQGNKQIGYVYEDCGNGVVHVVCMINGKRVEVETTYDLIEKVLKD